MNIFLRIQQLCRLTFNGRHSERPSSFRANINKGTKNPSSGQWSIARVSLILISLLNVNAACIAGNPNNPIGYAVATAHPLATNAGLEILAAGGNAFDAAVAVSAALAVVAPYHSGLGGGGFWLLHQAKNNKNTFIDGRETAALAAHRDMFLGTDGKLVPGLSLNGGLSAAIPGEPAALVYIAEHYGRLPFGKSLAPAIRLAKEGFIVDHQFNYFSTMDDRLEMLQRFPDTAAVFLHEGRAFQIGERLRQPDLAKTLMLLAQKGHNGFYRGAVAENLVKGVRKAGGIWTLDDLASYQIKVRKPLQGVFHNMLIITAPPPSAGGVALLTMLNILADYSLQSLSKVQWVHYLTESMRLTFWQRSQFLADPDFETIPLKHLLSAENAQQLRRLIPAHKALPSTSLHAHQSLTGKLQQKPSNQRPLIHPAEKGGSSLQVGISPEESKNTTHIAILDNEGNRVSATLTVNYIFGSSVVAAGTGVLLNDEMDDFSSKPGERNVYGITGGDKNFIQPGKRPLSSMTPTFLEMPGRVAIVGTPGGSRIPTMMLLASLTFSDYSGAISIVSAMRFHHQFLPDWLQVEPDTFSPSLQAELKKMGYHLMMLKQFYGDMQAITWDKENNLITAASDPRSIGLAAAITQNEKGYGLHY